MAEVEEAQNPIANVILRGKCYDGLSVGLKQSIRSIETKDAQLCILAKDCEEKKYLALITALCKEARVPLILFEHGRKKMGEMLGMCKLDKEGKPRKIVGCSVFVVRNNVLDTLSIESCKPLAVE